MPPPAKVITQPVPAETLLAVLDERQGGHIRETHRRLAHVEQEVDKITGVETTLASIMEKLDTLITRQAENVATIKARPDRNAVSAMINSSVRGLSEKASTALVTADKADQTARAAHAHTTALKSSLDTAELERVKGSLDRSTKFYMLGAVTVITGLINMVLQPLKDALSKLF